VYAKHGNKENSSGDAVPVYLIQYVRFEDSKVCFSKLLLLLLKKTGSVQLSNVTCGVATI